MKTGLLWKHWDSDHVPAASCLCADNRISELKRFQWGNQDRASYDEFPWACIFIIVILFMLVKLSQNQSYLMIACKEQYDFQRPFE